MYKLVLALNNLQYLLSHKTEPKTKPNQTKPNQPVEMSNSSICPIDKTLSDNNLSASEWIWE